MKLQNKETLRVFDVEIRPVLYKNIANIKLKDIKTGAILAMYNTLAELNAEWKDYEEPKEFWYIKPNGCIERDNLEAIECDIPKEYYDKMKEIGNTFETEEETEKAVEKLKAWTRLEDKGARFKGWFWDENYGTCIIIGDSEGSYIDDGDEQNKKDLDLLFSGEDN